MRYVKAVALLFVVGVLLSCSDFQKEEYCPTEFDEGMFSFLDNDYAVLKDTLLIKPIEMVDSLLTDKAMDTLSRNLEGGDIIRKLLDSLNSFVPGYKKVKVKFDASYYSGYFVLDLTSIGEEKNWVFFFDNYVVMTLWDPDEEDVVEVVSNSMPLEVVVNSKTAKERYEYSLMPKKYICRLKKSETIKGIVWVDMVVLNTDFTVPEENREICEQLESEENVVEKSLFSITEIDSNWTDMIDSYIGSGNDTNIIKIKNTLSTISTADFSKRLEFELPLKVALSEVVNDVGYVLLNLEDISDTIDVKMYVDDAVDVRIWDLNTGQEIESNISGIDINDAYYCGIFQKKGFRLAKGEYVIGYIPFEATEENVIGTFGCLIKN